MATIANRRSVMTLFSGEIDAYSHRVRIVLAEKGINFDTVNVDPENKPEDLIDLNPYAALPTLVDRDLVLYNSQVVMEYLDERFPHPPLMPVDPVSRANIRLMFHRLEKELFVLFDKVENAGEKSAARARKEIAESLIQINAVFEHRTYFMSEEYSLIDCALAPLLWRITHHRINVPKTYTPLYDYMGRIFEREAFQESLTEAEQDMNPL